MMMMMMSPGAVHHPSLPPSNANELAITSVNRQRQVREQQLRDFWHYVLLNMTARFICFNRLSAKRIYISCNIVYVSGYAKFFIIYYRTASVELQYICWLQDTEFSLQTLPLQTTPFEHGMKCNNFKVVRFSRKNRVTSISFRPGWHQP